MAALVWAVVLTMLGIIALVCVAAWVAVAVVMLLCFVLDAIAGAMSANR